MHHRRCHVALSFATLAFLVLASVLVALGVLLLNPTPEFGVAKLMKENMEERIISRRRLGGPGSWPPSCRSKCGWCSPCKPVHVPVQPGLSMPLEYYPEAWRCKCGNTLFMP